ncbi:MAG TPA: glycosyltransferase family 4 protein [Chitinophagaceae bacterium]|nr:glycosyltransferase family 4 protein [Chitinophagaceae bacterium]
MKIISTSYSRSKEYNDPEEWLSRISFYTGILEQLAKDHEVTSIERINYEGVSRRNGVNYYFMDLKQDVVRFPFRMHRVIRQFQPDVVLVNGLIFPLQVMQLKRKLGKRVKIIVLHRAERPSKNLKAYFQRAADRYVDHYLFASSEIADEWRRAGVIGDLDKIREIMQSSSVFIPTELHQAGDPEAPVFLWVGRLDANKDPITVLRAFTRFLTEKPSAKLVMIYQKDDLLDEVKDLIQSHDHASRSISLIGKVLHHDMQRWYNGADFIISGSHYEGSGISVLEAMSCGCIPILTNIASFRRMTGPGICGLLFEPGNADSLVDALRKTKQMDREKERSKTIQRFQSEFSFVAIAGKINALIHE